MRIALLAMLAACAAPANQTPADVRLPSVSNIVLVTIDTLRADMLGVYGGSAETPTLTRLAQQGWLFEECMSVSMLTNPSHASIMTSLYPRDHGVYDNESGIADDVHTLAAAMQRHGLRTGAVIGFPHLNPEVSNLGQGFEQVRRATREERRADDTSRQALSVLDTLAARDHFFLWVHYTDPHAPYEPPASHPPKLLGEARTPLKIAALAAPAFQRQNPWFKRAFRDYHSVEDLTARYVAEIETADQGLGTLLAGLSARGRLDDTAIVVTSDHGENLGEHRLYFHHGGLYRTSVHVPLIVALPGASPRRLAFPVQTVDIAPTVLALVGAPQWVPMRGRNLVTQVSGAEPPRRYVFSEHMLAQLVAVRGPEGTMILHRRTSKQFPTYPMTAGRREVYLAADEAEQNDVGASHPIATELEDALQGFLGAGLSLAARPALDQDRDSLRALGYIE